MKHLKIISLVLLCGLFLNACKTGGSSSGGGTIKPEKDPYPAVLATIADIDTGGVLLNFRAAQGCFYEKKDLVWNFSYLKGVNMGLTTATTDLNNPDISYETYTEWFKQITDMNANTVKIFTIMNPDFYRALYDFNQSREENPLYLLQGIWFNENYLYDIGTAYGEDGLIVKSFNRAVRETLDIIHGNSDYTSYGELSPAVYSYDVSPYIAGYILGLEWPADFVINTNSDSLGKKHSGKYLKTSEKASAFEAFLCEIGDGLIDYETRSYNHQTPVAFLNWQSTDPLIHTNEPFDEEDAVNLNTENIISTEKFFAGQFAAIDIYPYYPEFMNYQQEYVSFKDPSGKINPYRAYLRDLIAFYDVPVIVAEFGLPTSRGIAHESRTGYNQGGITEQQQGEYVSAMLSDIVKEGYAGAMIFSWQEEWFKQTWNTVKFAPDMARQRTPNLQSAEQSYGILAVEPGKTAVCLTDGKIPEWQSENLVVSSGDYDLYSKYDEGYLYFYIDLKTKKFGDETLYLPISTLGIGSGQSTQHDLSFSENADFLLIVDGKNNTRLLTDGYYDTFSFIYGSQKGVFDIAPLTRGSGDYNPIRTFISNEIALPVTGEVIAPKYYESGKLTFGNGNPSAADYNSQSDFYGKEKIIEIRIPWYLLNVMNSTASVAIADFNVTGEISFTTLPGVKAGISSSGRIQLSEITYATKEFSEYHTRLKKSYSIIAECMAGIYPYKS